MVFNSITFLAFFLAVFVLYYIVARNNGKKQNWILLISSYFFYGYVSLKMLPLLLGVTIAVYFIGLIIHKMNNQKMVSLFSTIGIFLSLGLLLYFKYFNFFIHEFQKLFQITGINTNTISFNVLLPLGISFFTFKLISYIVEIQRGKINPAKDFVVFSTYISFFPTILSGPIDKPNDLIPQLQKTKRSFNYNLITEGFRQFLWGLFQKSVIADNIAIPLNNVWGDIPNQSGIVLIIASLLYSIQLYTDFSGYSHMAIGVGKILGFKITSNFNYPFFSRNVAEFWRKWHISLTSWLTDYVFMPLNIKFRNFGKIGMITAIMINMIAVGIWHGANWTFVFFGVYHGLLFVPLVYSNAIFKKKKLRTNKYGLPSFIDFSKIVSTFFLISLALIMFRAENVYQFFDYFKGLFDLSIPSVNELRGLGLRRLIVPLIFAGILLITEWNNRDLEFPFTELEFRYNKPIRWAIYALLIFCVGMYMPSNESPFIYFQF